MELPADVSVHSRLLGLKGQKAVLLRVSTEGYYEMNLSFGERVHRVLMPIVDTVVIQQEPEVAVAEQIEVER